MPQIHSNLMLFQAGTYKDASRLWASVFPFTPSLVPVLHLSGDPGAVVEMRFLLADEHGVEMDRSAPVTVTLDSFGEAHGLAPWEPTISTPGVYWVVAVRAKPEVGEEPFARARLHARLKFKK